ncbi:hypothetical protein HF086_010678 [Spodoptera exigua]|uniref:Testis-expressed sequence 2 protein n=1 Tax=Spodoptera exigua TaxID=7107 RepID=A0A922SAN3_SPOEX|nr:hypothetical protein HF086_010678 [Spodoptera exigua]
MEISGVGKSPNASLSFRYNANNEELEELYHVCEDDPPTPQCDPPVSTPVENASPKRGERSSSIIDKYFKSIRSEKIIEKPEDVKPVESKQEEAKVKEAPVPKEVTSSPMKEYLNRLGKRSTPEVTPDVKEGSNETWKIFHDFKFKIAQAVEDMKTRSVEETKEKSIPRENSTSDSEENSAIKDSDQQSVGDTDNQVSSLDSSIQNLSEMTQPLTAKAAERDPSLPVDGKNYSDSSDDTHKNLAMYNDSAELRRDFLNDSLMEVESGIEALEDNIDGFGDIQNLDPQVSSGKDQNPIPPPPTPANFGSPPSKNDMKTPKTNTKPNHFCNFFMYFLTFLIFISYVLFPNSNIWNGFVLGLWFFCFMSNLKSWVLDTYFSDVEPSSSKLLQLKRSSAMPATYTIPSVKEHRPIKKYENWINHYRVPDYDPGTYHINKTTTAFMKLEGCNLRISYTSTKIPKRALWDEKLEKVSFYQHRLYNLTGARVILLPKGLVKRRQWSKKYPICIILSDKEKIQVLEKENSSAEKKTTEATPSEKKKEPQQPQHEMEAETNTSPEKKNASLCGGDEKRDKKTDSVSTATEPVETQSQSHVKTEKALCGEDSFHDQEIELSSRSVTSTKDDNDEEFDDNELTKIKEFLEETSKTTDSLSEGGGVTITSISQPMTIESDYEKTFWPYLLKIIQLCSLDITLEEQLMATSDTVLENDLQSAPNSAGFSSQALRLMKPAIYDSEVEDSAESSSDDESPPVQPVDSNETLAGSESGSMSNTTEGTSSKKKFLRMVDKIATNKYFQQVTDYKYVKRAMEGLSNTDIKLHLEVHALEGRLAINLPPPPHDRVWIGFRSNPQLILKARPAVGARTLRFAHITNWIEQKLSKEFEKVLVLPNMEDIIIDIMTPTPVQFE